MAESGLTKNTLATALKQLMTEKPFEKISVSDICDRCGMNRKSFYYHFHDKYDLVNWIFTTDFLETMDFSAEKGGWQLLLESCERLYEEGAFYRDALQIKGQNSFHDYVLETVSPIVFHLVRDLYQDDEIADFFVSFFGDAFLTAIMRWLSEETRMTPEEFVRDLRAACRGISRKILMDEGEFASPGETV